MSGFAGFTNANESNSTSNTSAQATQPSIISSTSNNNSTAIVTSAISRSNASGQYEAFATTTTTTSNNNDVSSEYISSCSASTTTTNNNTTSPPKTKEKTRKIEIFNKIFETHLWPMLEKDGWALLIQNKKVLDDSSANNVIKKIFYYVPPNATNFLESIDKVKEYVLTNNDGDTNVSLSSSSSSNKYVKEYFICWYLFDFDDNDLISYDDDIKDIIGHIEEIMLYRDLELFIRKSSSSSSTSSAITTNSIETTTSTMTSNLGVIPSIPIMNENEWLLNTNTNNTITNNNYSSNQEVLNNNNNDSMVVTSIDKLDNEEKEKKLLHEPLQLEGVNASPSAGLRLTEQLSKNNDNNMQKQSTRVESLEVSNNDNQVTSQVLSSPSPSLPPGFITFEKMMPRYMGSYHNLSPIYLFPPEKVQYLFHDVILAKYGLNPKDNNFLRVEVSDDPNSGEMHSVLFKAIGPKRLVDTVTKSIKTYIKGMIIFYDLYKLLIDKSSIIIDVLLSTSGSIGAYVFDMVEMDALNNITQNTTATLIPQSYDWSYGISNTIKNAMMKEIDTGIWISGLKKDGDSELKNVITQTLLKFGCCIIKVDDTNVKCRNDIIKSWSSGKDVDKKEYIKVTLCCNKRSDLSFIKNDRIVGIDDGNSPLTRGSGICKKWIFSKEKGFIINKKKEEVVQKQPSLSSPNRNSTSTSAYRTFVSKYQQVCDIEFFSQGFPKKLVYKSMWAQHKKLVGLTCPECCSCPTMLPSLCSNVIPYILDNVTHTAKQQFDKSDVGFIKYFYTRFYRKIVVEYPTCTPYDALRKLVNIWSKHRSIRVFGLQCRVDCPCIDEWDMFLNVLRDNASNNVDTIIATDSNTSTTSIAEKNKVKEKKNTSPTVMDANKSKGNTTSATTIAKATTVKEKKIIDLSLSTTPVAKTTAVKEKPVFIDLSLSNAPQSQFPPIEFSIDFTTNKSLGFYCITEELAASPGTSSSLKISSCKIYSINPFTKLDPRLQPGTTVLASSLTIGKRMKVELSSHKALQKRYETARKKGSSCKLQLYFVNDININDNKKYKDISSCNVDWTRSGQWQGNSGTGLPGWAGGAQVCVKRRGNSEVKVVQLPMASAKSSNNFTSSSINRNNSDPDLTTKATTTPTTITSTKPKNNNTKPNLLSLIKGATTEKATTTAKTTTIAKNASVDNSIPVLREPTTITTTESSTQSNINKIEETLKHARESLASSSSSSSTTTGASSSLSASTTITDTTTTAPKLNIKNVDGHIIKHRDVTETSEEKLYVPLPTSTTKSKKRVFFCTDVNTEVFFDPNSSIIDDDFLIRSNKKEEKQQQQSDPSMNSKRMVENESSSQPLKKPKLLASSAESHQQKPTKQPALLSKVIQQSQQHPSYPKPNLLSALCSNSATTSYASTTATPQITFSAESLSLAVREQNMQQVVKILKSGQVDAQSRDVNGKSPLEYIEEISRHHQKILNESNMNGRHISMFEREKLINELKDLSTKKKLLKIFINAAYYINNARFMEDWVTIEMCINKVENIHLSVDGVNEYTPYAFCTTIYNGQKQEADTSIKYIAEKISWEDDVRTSEDGIIEHIPNCMIRYNEFAYNDLDIRIHLIMGTPDKVEKNKVLGSSRVKYDCIQELIHQFSKADVESGKACERKITKPVVPSAYLQRAASIELFLRKLPFDDKFIIRKCEEIKKKMYDLIHWIQSFNKETAERDGDGDLLNYNIFAPNSNGFTLLHAAIYLEDAKLVQHLLELGADPGIVCPEGDAFALAKFLAETYNTVAFFDIIKVLESFGNYALDSDVLLEEEDDNGALNDDDIIEQGPQHKVNELSSNSVDDNDCELYVNLDTSPSSMDEKEEGDGEVDEDEELYGDLSEAPQRNKRKDHPVEEEKNDLITKRRKESEEFRNQLISRSDTKSEVIPVIKRSTAGETHTENLPTVANTDWMTMNGTGRCEFFNSSSGCTFGLRCKKIHVYKPMGKLLDHVSAMHPDELRRFVDDQFITKINAMGDDGKIYHTAAYRDEKNIIYYAEKGNNGNRSKQGLYWYLDSKSAEDAVRRVVVSSTYSTSDITPISQSEYHPPLPHVQKPDWMCEKLGKERCKFFEKGGKCKYRHDCLNLHFKKPFGSSLKFKAKNEPARMLQGYHIHTNTQFASDGKKWFSAAYMCPKEMIIYYAEGGNGFCSAQGLFWYSDMDSAVDTLGRMGSINAGPSKIKRDKTGVPMLDQPKWMEVSGAGATRCAFFNREQRCLKAAKCPNYHVHKPLGSILDKEEVIKKDLSQLLKDFCIFNKMETSNDGARWFTSAYCDPSEKIIYYAEKGVEGMKSSQGLYWYPKWEFALDAIRKVVYASSLTTAPKESNLTHKPSDIQPYNQGQERMHDYQPHIRMQETQPYMRTQDMPSHMRMQDMQRNTTTDPYMQPCMKSENTQPHHRARIAQPIKRLQDALPYMRTQDTKPHNKAQDASPKMSPYMRTQDRHKMHDKSANKGKDARIFQALVKHNLSNIHIKIHRGVSLLKVYWKTEFLEIDGEQRYTTNLNPHSHQVSLVYPSGCGGIFQNGLYWYLDERTAKAATYFTYLQELANMNVIRDPRHQLDGTKLF